MSIFYEIKRIFITFGVRYNAPLIPVKIKNTIINIRISNVAMLTCKTYIRNQSVVAVIIWLIRDMEKIGLGAFSR